MALNGHIFWLNVKKFVIFFRIVCGLDLITDDKINISCRWPRAKEPRPGTWKALTRTLCPALTATETRGCMFTAKWDTVLWPPVWPGGPAR
jgi:hypothetical protein